MYICMYVYDWRLAPRNSRIVVVFVADIIIIVVVVVVVVVFLAGYILQNS